MKHLFSLFLVFLFANSSFAQGNIGYQTPHDDILQLADVPLPPLVILNDEGDMAILLYRDQYVSIEDLSRQEMRLAGLRIDPKTNIGSRTRYYHNAELLDAKSGKTKGISGLPQKRKLANLSWSPDQSMFAVTNTTEAGVELWVVDVAKAAAKKITDAKVSGNMGRAFTWMADGESLLVKMVPEDKKPLIEKATAVPTGPTISENDGKKAQNRTYQDLLKDPSDEHNFKQLARSTIFHVDVNGNAKEWKETAMYSGMSVSPDGNYIMVTEIQTPFSYIVTYGRFPYTTTIYDKKGKKVKVVNAKELEEERPQGFMSTTKGKRRMSWRADRAATLVWAEALDGGDANVEAEYRDEVFQLDAPFNGQAQSILKTKDRFSGITWGKDNVALAYDYWWNTRNTRTYIFDPSDDSKEPMVLVDRNYQDNYSNPGGVVTTRNEMGRSVIAFVGDKMLYDGPGYSPEGIYPFIDEVDASTGEKTRVWQAQPSDKQETIVDVLDPKKGLILERIESPTEFPNLYVRNIRKGGKPQAMTNFENPFQALEDVHKEVIKYTREDGLELSGTLYLPAGYDMKKKEKLPMVLWAYPREYKDKSSAGQVTSSDKEFTYPYYGSAIYWVNRGYAVLDDASFPIVGEDDEEPNDTFIEQLVANGKAAIDAVDNLGYIDRDRVAVGGHSYGAFMTANLLTHSDLFAAGIARSGAYNRSLTPFGFQSEERDFWEGQEVYMRMSPFMNADKMKHPLLLIHGAADNNSGTYPMQSERYFNALKGLGATVKLVMLPKESHGYRAKESIMHMLWEQDQWLEKYVKNKNVDKPSN